MSFDDVVGSIAVSKSGNDKGSAYVITKVVDDKFVLVVNGENRLLDTPKRKNIRHLSVTKNRTAATSDLEIRKVLKEFGKRSE